MGFRGMSPKQMARMMKKMGIEQTELSGVREVIIRFEEKEWVISQAQVTMIKQGGLETFQVVGSKTEQDSTAETLSAAPQKKEKEVSIPVEDAALVASQAGVSIEVAMEALREADGDLAAAILRLRHR